MIRLQRFLPQMFLFFVVLNGRLPQASGQTRPTIVAEASYPGANSLVVADTVAAPIEQQVLGVEGLVHMVSRSRNDGTYTLLLWFQPGADLNISQVLVQNRVALATPILPDVVKRRGLTVKKKSQTPALFICLTSPKGQRNVLFLSHYAADKLQGELARLSGVGDVTLVGQRSSQVLISIDLDKLESRKLTIEDVVRSVKETKLQVTLQKSGHPLLRNDRQALLIVHPQGQSVDPDEFGDIILKVDVEGRQVRLKDVAESRLETEPHDNLAISNGKPAVLLTLNPVPGTKPGQLSKAVKEKLAQLTAKHPDGVRIEPIFDFAEQVKGPERPATPELLLLDLAMPASTTPARTCRVVQRCDELLRGTAGVQDVLSISENPFDLARTCPCLLVRLAPADSRQVSREEVTRTIRARLNEVEKTTVRVRDLSKPGLWPEFGYPIDLAVQGPEDTDVRTLAENLAGRLRKENKLADVWLNTEALPRHFIEVALDRKQASDRGVPPKEILSALENYLGPLSVTERGKRGLTAQVQMQFDGRLPDRIEEIKKLQVRNAKGESVPLGALVTVQQVGGSEVHYHIDGKPMMQITANLGKGASLDQARKHCEAQLDELRKELKLSREYRLTWLNDSSGSR
jgi:multidrug efflux pump subunit AcrB